MPLLAAENLHKTYVTGEARVTALAGVSFAIERGDFAIALSYVLASVLGSVMLLFAGLWLVRASA